MPRPAFREVTGLGSLRTPLVRDVAQGDLVARTFAGLVARALRPDGGEPVDERLALDLVAALVGSRVRDPGSVHLANARAFIEAHLTDPGLSARRVAAAIGISELTEGGRKATGVDARVLPQAVVYDAGLMVSLPVPMSVASGLNAVAHCVDSMWAPRVDPIDQALALEGIRALGAGLPEAVRDPPGMEGREQTLYGAYLAAVAFASADSGLHHKICHVLGGCTTCRTRRRTPWCCRTCSPSTHPPSRGRAAVGGRLRGPVRPRGAPAPAERCGRPRALRDYGLRKGDIPAAVNAVLANVPPGNPRQVTAADLEELLRGAWEGRESR